MDIKTTKNGEKYAVLFTHGVQTFVLDYHVDTLEEAEWMKKMLSKCFATAFGNDWHKRTNTTKPNYNEREFLISFLMEIDECYDTHKREVAEQVVDAHFERKREAAE